MQKKTRFLMALVALALIGALPVWGGGNTNRAAASSATNTGILRGANVILGSWYSDYNANIAPANETEAARRTREWRARVQRDYGFTMEEKTVAASWGDYRDMLSVSIMSGNPSASIFVVEPPWAMSLLRQNLLYPVGNNTAVDFYNPQPVEPGAQPVVWNTGMIDAFTVRGNAYAFQTGIGVSNMVVFFNKRLFREAGIDPELPYNMQRDGTWNWEAFVNLARRLTRDTNNDGIVDTYALTRDWSQEILQAVVGSNGAAFVDKDANGRFVNATSRPEFLEALQFAIRLDNEGIMKPQPAGAAWDWFINEFPDGNVAMWISTTNRWNGLGNMRDEWGVVFFPRGPRAPGASNTFVKYTHENVMIVPSTYTAAQVNQIMLALAFWQTPVNTDDWRASWWDRFHDARAVNETLYMLLNPPIVRARYHFFIPGISEGNIAWSMWNYEGQPAQLVESVAPNWNALIQEVNDDLFPR